MHYPYLDVLAAVSPVRCNAPFVLISSIALSASFLCLYAPYLYIASLSSCLIYVQGERARDNLYLIAATPFRLLRAVLIYLACLISCLCRTVWMDGGRPLWATPVSP